MQKRKIIDLRYFRVCCKRRKRGDRAGSSQAPVLGLCSRGCSPSGCRAGAMANACSGQGSAATAARQGMDPPERRPRHLPPPQPGSPCSPPGTDPRSHLQPRLRLSCPPATAAMILMPPPACPPVTLMMLMPPPARPASRPLSPGPPTLPPSLPRRSPNQTTPDKPQTTKKSAGEVLRLCGLEKRRLRAGDLVGLCGFLRRGGGEGGVELFSLVPRTGRVGMVQSCSLSLHWTLGIFSLPRGTALPNAVRV